jgi:thiamine biosynthesis lipoprotein
MNRRELLSRHTAGQILNLLDDAPAESVSDRPPLIQVGRRAMATLFEIMLPFGTPDATLVASEALDRIDELEDQLSVYRDHSEVCRLNQEAFPGPVALSRNLFDLLQLASRIHRDTQGAFDIGVGALLKCWGFFRGPKRVPPHVERLTALRHGGMRNVVLNPQEETIQFREAGVEINLGSIGKGYALDESAILLRQRHRVTSALLHGGHSSVLAIGGQPGSRLGWEIAITHPWQPERRLAVVRLKDRALATSAATFQHLEYNGQKLGHILDPRTGWPAEGVASCSVLAPTAAEADALATAFFVLGVEKAQQYCDAHPDVGSVILPNDDATPVRLGFALSEAVAIVPDR